MATSTVLVSGTLVTYCVQTKFTFSVYSWDDWQAALALLAHD